MDTYEGRIGSPETLHKYAYANQNPISFSDPSGLFSMSEALATITIAAILVSIPGSTRVQVTCNDEPTAEEKRNRESAVYWQQFVAYIDNNKQTYDELMMEAGTGEDSVLGMKIGFPKGPTASYRYIEDLDDTRRAIDMKHFLYFGSYQGIGEALGHLYEVRQAQAGWRSAYLLEDYRSNYFGTVFRSKYYTSDDNLAPSFTNFFNDLGSGKIKYKNCPS